MPSLPLDTQPKVETKAPKSQLPLVIIVGPTAVGKTGIAVQLAERLNGEIISADSRLFYRGMDIGTAKPSFEERQRVPHHLVDVADPDEVWSLSLFQKCACQAISDIYARGKLPFLVGGTGQYIRAVVHGWQVPKVSPHPQMRAALESWAQVIGGVGLHQRLSLLDPTAAGAIDPRNLRRTVRALEVILTTGNKFSVQRVSAGTDYKILTLGLSRPRAELYARIDTRIEVMIQAGLVEEVKNLLGRGYPAEAPAFSAIGYQEIVSHLQGKYSLDEAVSQIKRSTRVFVRRQANWFKPDDPGIRWFSVGERTLEEMERVIQEWLQGSEIVWNRLSSVWNVRTK